MSTTTKYNLIIDTNKLVSPFIVDFLGYVTGDPHRVIGYNKTVNEARAEIGDQFEDLKDLIRVDYVPGLNGYCELSYGQEQMTPGFIVHPRRGVFEFHQLEQARQHYAELEILDQNRYIKSINAQIKNIDLGNPLGYEVLPDISYLKREREIANYKIKLLKESANVNVYYADLSIAIFLTERPDQDILDLIKARAYMYTKRRKGLEITGFRLEETKTIVTTSPI